MKNTSCYHFLIILFCILILQTQILPQTPPLPVETPATINQRETEASLLHLGDLIEVDVIGSVEYDWRGNLNPEGFLNGINFTEFPVYGLCRSEEAVANDVEKAYTKLLRDPQVVVRILDRSNRPLSVLYGAVRMPQRFQIKREVSLTELIIASGGITDKASGEIEIYRTPESNCQPKPVQNPKQTTSIEKRERFVKVGQDNGQQFINIRINELLAGKKEANPMILSGDVITVLEAQPIYITGGVENPKQISVNSKITLSRAINSAGGVTKQGNGNKITIFRRGKTGTQIIEADLEKIKNNVQEDILLQAFDIVEVEIEGKERSRFPPQIGNDGSKEKNPNKLPLRIVD